jgi:hAT family C-terminal dimerisation region
MLGNGYGAGPRDIPEFTIFEEHAHESPLSPLSPLVLAHLASMTGLSPGGPGSTHGASSVFAISRWWIQRRAYMPCLYKLALKHVIVPASSSSSERAASRLGQTLNKYVTRMDVLCSECS